MLYMYTFVEPLDELSDLVLPLFSLVENTSVEIPFWTGEPYGPDHIKVTENSRKYVCKINIFIE